MSRVGFWGALMAWEEARRPVPLPVPVWTPMPQPVVPSPADVVEAAPPQEQLG